MVYAMLLDLSHTEASSTFLRSIKNYPGPAQEDHLSKQFNAHKYYLSLKTRDTVC